RSPRRSTRARGIVKSRASGAWIFDDVLPFAGVRSCNDGNHGLSVAYVADLVRNSRLDENKIAGNVFHGLREVLAILVSHATFEDIQHHLEVDVNVGVRNSARWNRCDIHRKVSSSNI